MATYIKNNIYCELIDIPSPFETITIQANIPTKTTICNIYIPNSQPLRYQDLLDYFSQLPKPIIIVGDFNSHNILWGSINNDNRGKEIEKLCDNTNLIILNNGNPTHISLASNSLSSIDLSLCSSNIAQNIRWWTNDYTYDSDHFPIHLQIGTSVTDESPEKPVIWNTKKADWSRYSLFASVYFNQIQESATNQNASDPDTLVNTFTQHIIYIAENTIPKYHNVNNKRKLPWWNHECSIAIKKAKSDFNKYKKHADNIYLKIEYKKSRAKVRQILNEARKNSWRQFISNQLNSNTSNSQIWKTICRIKGQKYSEVSYTIFDEDDIAHTSPTQKTNILANTFTKNSSDLNYTPQFLAYKHKNEFKFLKESKQIDQQYLSDINIPFSMTELLKALKSCKNTSPGNDNIPSILIQQLPISGLEQLLIIYNKIWLTNTFPSSWKLANIVPIAKPGKNHTLATNYRPIALTCNLCKILEKMINNRLVWILEKSNWFSPFQNGFRKFRSTTNHLTTLHKDICSAFADNLHLVAISFDLEKAFEMVCQQRIVTILSNLGFNGNFLAFIKNFLLNRRIQVKSNNWTSTMNTLENGVPQGSVLSVTLFLMAINDIVSCINPPTKCLLFADDLTVYMTGKNIDNTLIILQKIIDNLSLWCNLTGFKFSSTKTSYIIFHKPRTKITVKSSLFLNGTKLKRCESLKILGLIFDYKLSWLPHINNLKKQCNQKLNIIKSISSTRWGADSQILINTYKALIRSKLDYGAIIYCSATTSTLERLNSVQTTTLRIAFGAFKTSPKNSIITEAHELPLEIRRAALLLNFASSWSLSSNKTFKYSNLEDKHLNKIINKHKHLPSPYHLKAKELLEEFNIQNIQVSKRFLPLFPPWESQNKIIIDLSIYEKSHGKKKPRPSCIELSFPNWWTNIKNITPSLQMALFLMIKKVVPSF